MEVLVGSENNPLVDEERLMFTWSRNDSPLMKDLTMLFGIIMIPLLIESS